MNQQKPPNAIEWTRVWGRPGYTWNPVSGCMHECQWTMPDGTTAICYAKTVAERVAQAAYPQGFAHHYWHPKRLQEPLTVKEPAGIFMDSMSDLMGINVPEDQINQVLDICRRAEQHVFFLLTKNAPRLAKFKFPSNVWVGASSPPDSMHGRSLDHNQQAKMLDTTLRILNEVDVPVRWMSFEPLSWNVTDIVARARVLQWAVIGAASNGRNEFPPHEVHLMSLLDVLDRQRVPVFFKGNLKSLPYAVNNWRSGFPSQNKHAAIQQHQKPLWSE